MPGSRRAALLLSGLLGFAPALPARAGPDDAIDRARDRDAPGAPSEPGPFRPTAIETAPPPPEEPAPQRPEPASRPAIDTEPPPPASAAEPEPRPAVPLAHGSRWFVVPRLHLWLPFDRDIEVDDREFVRFPHIYGGASLSFERMLGVTEGGDAAFFGQAGMGLSFAKVEVIDDLSDATTELVVLRESQDFFGWLTLGAGVLLNPGGALAPIDLGRGVHPYASAAIGIGYQRLDALDDEVATLLAGLPARDESRAVFVGEARVGVRFRRLDLGVGAILLGGSATTPSALTASIGFAF